jgi:thymidylate synthase ThyX
MLCSIGAIADLAHIPMAVENISLLAAIEVVDEQKWDGQERSTRYQDFSKRLYYVPQDLDEVELAHYHRPINMLFDAYDMTFAAALEAMRTKWPSPAGMKEEDAERTRRARAFDIARYCLPMATLTSVGQITSARTLESQISRMKASDFDATSGGV